MKFKVCTVRQDNRLTFKIQPKPRPSGALAKEIKLKR